METKHTPTPWRAPFLSVTDGDDYIQITDEDQTYGVCRLDESYSEHREVMKANAALIVKAVNLHDELVEALEFLMEIDPASGEVLTLEKYQEFEELLAKAKATP